MDSHWIDREIQQIRARDQQRAGKATLGHQRAAILQVKAPQFFTDVLQDIRGGS